MTKRIITVLACALALIGCIGGRDDGPDPYVAPADVRSELLGRYTGPFTTTGPAGTNTTTIVFDVALGTDDRVQLADPGAPDCPAVQLRVTATCDMGYACGTQIVPVACLIDGYVITVSDTLAVWDGVDRMVVQETFSTPRPDGSFAEASGYFDGRRP